MSRVKRLSIRGIRNFGDDNEELIKFTRPLTLIIGQNGVGKTTIIEALRYASTGEFPPGSDRGRGFIHDPRLKKSVAHVRGVVKAEFVDRKGLIVTVRRTIEATKRATTLQFKTVENTISTKNKETGEECQINQRCTDIDKEMTNSLGLSPAILNNVIFCHQDDSNWPMDDGKKLKERFDEIFDTTHYNKALDLLRKTIKVKQADVRKFDVELGALKIFVQEVQSKEAKLQDLRARRVEATSNIEALIVELEPIKNKIRERKNDEEHYGALMSDKEKKQVELELAMQKRKSLEESIKELFKESDKELERILADNDQDFNEKNNKIVGVESRVQELARIESECANSLADQRVRVGTLRQQLEEQTRKVRDRNLILNEILRTCDLEEVDDKTSEGLIRNSVEKVESKLHKIEQEFEDLRKRHDQQEAELEKTVDLERNKRAKIDFELKQSQKEIADTRDTMKNVRSDIAKANDAAKKLDEINDKLEKVKKQVDDLTKTIENKNMPQLLKAQEEALATKEQEFAKVDELMSQMQSASALRSKFENLSTEMNVKWKEIDELKKKHGSSIKELLGTNEIPSSKLKDRVNSVQMTLNERLNKLRQEISSEQNKATSLETMINHAKKEMNTKISEIQRDKERIMTHCPDYNNYEETLLLTGNKLKALENKRGMYAYQGAAYAAYVEKLSSPKPCCPLCVRDFSTREEAAKVVDTLNQDLKNHPKRLKQCEEELSAVRAKHETLLSLRTTVEKVLKFEKDDKKNMSNNIMESQKLLEAKKNKIKELERLTEELDKKINVCNNLSGDLALWDKCLHEIERIQDVYEEVQVQIIELGLPDKSMDEIRNEYEALKQEVKGIREKISLLREEMDTYNKELRNATESRAICLEEQLSVHNQVQRVKQLREHFNRLVEKENKLREKNQEFGKMLVVADGELDVVVRQLEEVKSSNRDEQDKLRKRLQEFTKQVDKLMSVQTELVNLQSRKIDVELKVLECEMSENERQLDDTKEEVTKLKEKLVELREDVSCHEVRRRNLQDNQELRKCKAAIGKLSQAVRALETQIREVNINKVRQDLEEHQQRVQMLEKQINIARGSEQELNLSIIQLDNDLQKEEYCTAKQKYKNKWLEKNITDDAIIDALTYCKVLDAAMSKYHEDRMNSVNKSMNNLWKHIYNGTDTTSIQIRTEAATTTGTLRRSFNYKLVQIKHGEEIDMRGRCSAGQRVLASIVIRLALAETFCDQCSMLALDEPTTNLDAANSASLAETLFNYVTLRSKFQKSFQLIIITHDEHFIHKLSQLNSSSGFYQLYRNDEGLTNIQYLVFDQDTPSERQLAPDDGGSDDEVEKKAAPRKKDSLPRSKKRPLSPSASTSATKKPYDFSL
ncbi:DNA repair protein RAD50 [Microplitis demolitor]|uniref:DNA repair protein RAD50 n=1 Tax=Microplitis demolitor TaxID=69319 RepID=UPI0004CD72DD|nr:DNA repair protein RAD50 [Microplitis demolitor]